MPGWSPGMLYGPQQGPRDLPGWAQDAVVDVLPALRRSCAAWRAMPAEQPLGGEGPGSRAGDWAAACTTLAALPPRPAGAERSRRVVAWLGQVRAFFEQGFHIAEIGTSTMTGYYEPTLRGDLARSEIFATPLLAAPPRDWARRQPRPDAGGQPAPAAVEASTARATADPGPGTPSPADQAAPTGAAATPPPAAQALAAQPPAADPPVGPGTGGAARPVVDAAAAADAALDPPTAEAAVEPPRAPPPPAATAARRPVTRSAPAVAPRAPFPSRGEIEDGALAGHGLELVWVDSAVDAFFLHIQGSGRVLLPDGRLLRLGYAAQNGHPYRAIGRILIERGLLRREDMSMQAIRGWLGTASADVSQALMRSNASYIFFRFVDGLRPEDGPIGAMGVPLTPLRSVAVDPAFVPLGAPLFLAGAAPLPRLVVGQDTGGAIRGAGRVDLFWGWSEEAGTRAGGTFQPVRMFLLRPRPAGP